MMDDVRNKQARGAEIPVGPYNITLQNLGAIDGELLVGAEFELTHASIETHKTTLTCDENGQVGFTLNDGQGTWSLQQTKAPVGYKLDQTLIEFDVREDGFDVIGDAESTFYDYKDGILTVKNSPEPFAIKLYVYDGQFHPLAGAEFSLYSDYNMTDCVGPIVSNEKGEVVFSDLSLQQYYLVQTKAPDGFILPTKTDGKPKKIWIRAGIVNGAYNFWVNMGGVPNQKPQEVRDGAFYNASANGQHVLAGQFVNQKEESTDTETPPSKAMKVVTNNSLAELIRLVKAQSSKVLNVTVNHTIDTYTPMGTPTAKKKFYADIPCTQSKTTMNVQISPNDSVENPGLLTYAEPMDGKVRVYFSEQPTESYIVDSVELTPVIEVKNTEGGAEEHPEITTPVKPSGGGAEEHPEITA